MFIQIYIVLYENLYKIHKKNIIYDNGIIYLCIIV